MGVQLKQPPGIWQGSAESGPATSGVLPSKAVAALGVQTCLSVSQMAWPNRAQSAAVWHWVASVLKSRVQPWNKSSPVTGKASATVDQDRFATS